MSIAIAVVLRPSKLLRIYVSGFALFLILIAIYLGGLNTISGLCKFVLVTICVGTALKSILLGYNAAKATWQISIDGKGHFRCQPMTLKSNTRVANVVQDHVSSGLPMESILDLVSGTTLWANILILRVKNGNNEVSNLVILRDSLEKDEFRRLSIACKWIVSRNNVY